MGGPVLDGRHVLLGVGGGIAAYKAAALARALRREGATVQTALTEAATHFVGTATFEGLTGRRAYTHVFEETERITHVRLAREADVAVFAPATANMLAKFAAGIADDLVSTLYLCCRCPVLVAPAMHTEMWEHPATVANLRTLAARGVHVVGPEEGELAGGDVGPGRLAEEDAILGALAGLLGARALAGRRVVVTAGGTREPIDPVRYVGNRSSGRMGHALAAEAARLGAVVELVSTAHDMPVPAGVRLHPVETALEMREAVLRLARDADVVVKAAAVADFRPARAFDRKVKKDSDALRRVDLVPNPDILSELAAEGGARILVGFAAETDLVEEHARDKLRRKGLDLIVANPVDRPDAGFGVDTNRAVLLGADGSRDDIGLTTKAELARVVWGKVTAMLSEPRRDPRAPVAPHDDQLL